MAPFASVLCAVNGSRLSAVAAQRAVALADPDTDLAFIAVVDGVGVRRAEKALAAAARLAAKAGVPCERVLDHTTDPAGAIFARAADHDLLVLGAPAASRAIGILAGSVGSVAAHRAPGPVLLARGRPDPRFPRHIVVATDGSDGARPAVETAAELARAGSVPVTLACAGVHDVTKHAAILEDGLGIEPYVALLGGAPHEALATFAAEVGADLLVVGSRALRGPRALGSTSERVAHDARTSVLIVRPRLVRVSYPALSHAAHAEARELRARAFVEPPAPR
jgi:nucleotide-binding universal stress UspA family protein